MAGQRPLHARGRARPLPRPAGARTPARRHPPGRPRQAPAGGGMGRVGAAPRAGALTGQALQGRAVLRGPGAERPPLPDHRGTAPQRLRAGQRRPAARGLLAAARRAGKPGRAALAADLAAAARRAAVPALRARHPVRGGRRAGAMSTVASAGAAATPAPAPDFELPAALLAAEPPEARGLSRGGVRLMVSRGRAWPVPAEFRELPGHLRPGDLVVVNTSSTLPAVLPARRPDGGGASGHAARHGRALGGRAAGRSRPGRPPVAERGVGAARAGPPAPARTLSRLVAAVAGGRARAPAAADLPCRARA